MGPSPNFLIPPEPPKPMATLALWPTGRQSLWSSHHAPLILALGLCICLTMALTKIRSQPYDVLIGESDFSLTRPTVHPAIRPTSSASSLTAAPIGHQSRANRSSMDFTQEESTVPTPPGRPEHAR